MRLRYLMLAVLVSLLPCAFASADQVSDESGRVRFLKALAQRESGGRKGIVNPYRYLGLFQMGEGALQDAGFYNFGKSKRGNKWDGTFTARAEFAEVTSKEDYLRIAAAQELAVRAYHDVQWKRLSALGMNSKIGTQIGNAVLSKSGLIAGAHLVGAGSVVKFVRSNGAEDPPDGNGVPVSDYITLFQKYY